jgi:5-methylcytosine-specific restriction endonuclease McrA
MSRRKSNNRRRVRRLWSFCKNCYWCGKETKLQVSGEGRANSDTATFDHLYHRSNPLRKTKAGTEGVLACYECNQKRGIEEERKTYQTLIL